MRRKMKFLVAYHFDSSFKVRKKKSKFYIYLIISNIH